jgi:hypothetical protein
MVGLILILPILAKEQYITIGWGRDYFDVIPLA